jgi:hypothetical protein
MGWNTNAVGVVIDKTTNADFAALKAAGFSFVVIEAGLGFDGSPALADHIQKAKDAGLPVIAQWTPFPAYDDYTFEALPREEIQYAQKALANKLYHAFSVSIDRYWTGLDVETGHNPIRVATDTAISYVASEFANTFTKMLAPLNRPVLIRTNDNFVQKYSPGMSSWTDKFGFYLADWRYRTRAADGTYSIYTLYPTMRTPIASMAELRAAMPPEGAKNPLVPGNIPQLKFWEYSGDRYVLPWVKGWDGSEKRVKVVLFNGDEQALQAYLFYGTPVPVDPPTTPTTPASTDLQRVVNLLAQISVDIAAIRQDVHDIRVKFS